MPNTVISKVREGSGVCNYSMCLCESEMHLKSMDFLGKQHTFGHKAHRMGFRVVSPRRVTFSCVCVLRAINPMRDICAGELNPSVHKALVVKWEVNVAVICCY